MRDATLKALRASDPLGFLAALGTLRVVARTCPAATLRWTQEGEWRPVLAVPEDVDVVDALWRDVERWRGGHRAIDFARDAPRKVQDLKHPPDEFRVLMRRVSGDPQAEPFIAAYATGVAVDTSGQTKPTAFHLTAGQQRFMDPVLSALDTVTREDLREAVFGPWEPREGKSLRWRAASERSRALLSYDPGKTETTAVVGAEWLAFQALPFYPAVPRGRHVLTTGFTGRGRRQVFTWPVWSSALAPDEVRVTLGMSGVGEMDGAERRARGIVRVFQAGVVRSSQGYGNLSAARPV